MALSEDEFNRLPADVQREIRSAEHTARVNALAYAERTKNRAIGGAILSGVGAMVFGFFVSDQILFFILLCLACATAGWFTVWLRFKLFGGMVLIGSTGVFVNVVGSGLGYCAPVLFVWLFYFGLGAIVGAWTDGQRSSEDNPY